MTKRAVLNAIVAAMTAAGYTRNPDLLPHDLGNEKTETIPFSSLDKQYVVDMRSRYEEIIGGINNYVTFTLYIFRTIVSGIGGRVSASDAIECEETEHIMDHLKVGQTETGYRVLNSLYQSGGGDDFIIYSVDIFAQYERV